MADYSNLSNPSVGLGVAHRAVDIGSADDFVGCGRKLWVGSAGNIVLTDLKGTNATYLNVPVGEFTPGVQFQAVVRSGTTAGDMVVIF